MKTNPAISLAVMICLFAILCRSGAAFGHVLPGLPPMPGEHHAANSAGMDSPLVPMAATPAAAPAKTPRATSASTPSSPLPPYLVPVYTARFFSSLPGAPAGVSTGSSYFTAVDSQGDVAGYYMEQITEANGAVVQAPQGIVYIASPNIVVTLSNQIVSSGSPIPCIVPTGVGGYQQFTDAEGNINTTVNLVGYEFDLDPTTGAVGPQQAASSEAFLQKPTSGLTLISTANSLFGTLSGGTFSAAMGLDDTGTYAVGYGDNGQGQIHAFIANFSDANGSLVDLGAFPPSFVLNGQAYNGAESAAYQVQINSAGPAIVAGDATNGAVDELGNPVLNSFEAVLPATSPPDASSYEDYITNDFSSLELLPSPNQTVDSEAFATDSFGDLAGAYDTGGTDINGNPIYNAYRVTSGGGFIPLGAEAAGDDSYAYGVNDTGYVVGESVTSGGVVRGFLADPVGDFYLLQDLAHKSLSETAGVNIDFVGGINESGVIVGAAINGGTQGVILTPNGAGAGNVTANVTITKGALAYNHSEGLWDQDVTVSAPGLVLGETYNLFVTGLAPTTASLYNSTARYTNPLNGRSYLYIAETAASTSVVYHLEFSAPSTAHITYTPSVYAGQVP